MEELGYNLKSRKDFKLCVLFLICDISGILHENVLYSHEDVINWIDELVQLREIFNKNDVTVDDVNFVTWLCDELHIKWYV